MTRQVAFLMSVLCVSQAASGNPEIVARFKAEYPAATRRLQERFAQVKGTYRLEETWADKSRPTRITKGEFAVSGGREKVSFQREFVGSRAPAGSGMVYCVGNDFAFKLVRLPAGGYNVSGINKLMERSLYNKVFGRYLKAPFSLDGIPLDRLMANPRFQIIDAERIEENGRSAIKVHCAMTGGAIPESMEFTLQPDAGWRLIKSKSKIINHEYAIDVEYVQGDGLDIYPSKVTTRDERGNVGEAMFESWSLVATPPEEFTMPFFGMPDLVSGSGHFPSSVKKFLIWGAIVGFVLSAALVLIVRPRRSSTAPGNKGS